MAEYTETLQSINDTLVLINDNLTEINETLNGKEATETEHAVDGLKDIQMGMTGLLENMDTRLQKFETYVDKSNDLKLQEGESGFYETFGKIEVSETNPNFYTMFSEYKDAHAETSETTALVSDDTNTYLQTISDNTESMLNVGSVTACFLGVLIGVVLTSILSRYLKH